jgi:hypothetical protein
LKRRTKERSRCTDSPPEREYSLCKGESGLSALKRGIRDAERELKVMPIKREKGIESAIIPTKVMTPLTTASHEEVLLMLQKY